MMDPSSVDEMPRKPSQEDEILELAKKELLREIKCASIRAEQFGAHSWAKPQKYVPSKRFLKQMIVNDSRFNDRKEQKSSERREVSRSWHSSSYIRHIGDQSEKSSKTYLSHSRRSKKREISSEDEEVGNKTEHLYRENVKHHSRRKMLRKSTVVETYKEIESSNTVNKSIKNPREKSHSRKEKHSQRIEHRKNSLLGLDKKRIVSSDEEDKQIKNFQSVSGDKEKHSKRKKQKKIPFEVDDKLSVLYSKHVANTKEISPEDKEISLLSRHGEKHSKKYSKKKTSKRHK